MKNKRFKEEMKGFRISVDDIKPSDDLFGEIQKAIIKMRDEYFINRLEVVLNGNLIECKEKLSNYRTILGCRISYDNLPTDVSFIVKEDMQASYEELEARINEAIYNATSKIKQYEGIVKGLKNGAYSELSSSTIHREILELTYRIREQEDLIKTLKGGKYESNRFIK